MNKGLLLLVCIFCFSCNNESSSPGGEKVSTTAAPGNATKVLSEESELEILAGCVDNAKATLGDARAFALCKCVLGQVQEKHPDADSAALITYLSDTTEVAAMAKDCK